MTILLSSAGQPRQCAEARGAPASALQIASRSASQQAPREGQIHLTPRQREVLSLLCAGLSNKLICRQLRIAGGTVKVHITCILRELRASSRLEAVALAYRYGLDTSPAVPEPSVPGSGAEERASRRQAGPWDALSSGTGSERDRGRKPSRLSDAA